MCRSLLCLSGIKCICFRLVYSDMIAEVQKLTSYLWFILLQVDGDTVFLKGDFTPFTAEEHNGTWNEQVAVAETAVCLQHLLSWTVKIKLILDHLTLLCGTDVCMTWIAAESPLYFDLVLQIGNSVSFHSVAVMFIYLKNSELNAKFCNLEERKVYRFLPCSLSVSTQCSLIWLVSNCHESVLIVWWCVTVLQDYISSRNVVDEE